MNACKETYHLRLTIADFSSPPPSGALQFVNGDNLTVAFSSQNLQLAGAVNNGNENVNPDPGNFVVEYDLTPGTPPHIRKQALANAVSFCGPERLMFGTDSFCGSGGVEYAVESELPGDLAYQKRTIDADLRILDELGLDEAQKERIMSGTADELFPPRR